MLFSKYITFTGAASCGLGFHLFQGDHVFNRKHASVVMLIVDIFNGAVVHFFWSLDVPSAQGCLKVEAFSI